MKETKMPPQVHAADLVVNNGNIKYDYENTGHCMGLSSDT